MHKIEFRILPFWWFKITLIVKGNKTYKCEQCKEFLLHLPQLIVHLHSYNGVRFICDESRKEIFGNALINKTFYVYILVKSRKNV